MQRFEPKVEAGIIKALSKFLKCSEPITEEEAIKRDDLMTITECQVMMVIARTEKAKRVLSRFTDKEFKGKIPELDYIASEEVKSKYNIEYLNYALRVVKAIDKTSSVNLFIKKDYPITLEIEDFKFIIAPKIENE